MDVHGAVPEEIEYSYPATPWRQSNIVIATRLEDWICRESDMIICQSEAMIEHLRNKHPSLRAPLVVYRCAADLTRFRMAGEIRDRTRHELGFQPGDAVIVYLGTLHRWQMPRHIFRLFLSAKTALGPQAKLLMITPDPAATVMRSAEAEGVRAGDMVIRTVVPGDVPKMLAAADVGLLPRENVAMNRVASPTKLAEYLACGLPVVVTPVALHWPGVREAPECFLGYNPDSSSFPDWTAFFRAPEDHRRQVAERCRQIASRYYSEASNSETLRGQLNALSPAGRAFA
jgi:glycosyltransferase involved in cell wall biosynthesis